MVWVLKLEEVRDNKTIGRRKVLTLNRPACVDSADDVGLSLDETKRLLSSVQQLLATSQFQ